MFTQTSHTHWLCYTHSWCQVWLHTARNKYTLAFMKAWVNAHPRWMATDVAFTTEYGWMHTHDIRPWMLPSLKVRVPAHPRRTPGEFLGDVQQRLNKYTSSCQCKGVGVGCMPSQKLLHTNLNWRIKVYIQIWNEEKRFMWKYWINQFYFSTARIHQINMVTYSGYLAKPQGTQNLTPEHKLGLMRTKHENVNMKGTLYTNTAIEIISTNWLFSS